MFHQKDLLRYVKERRAKGQSDDVIRTILGASGWDKGVIEAVLNRASLDEAETQDWADREELETTISSAADKERGATVASEEELIKIDKPEEPSFLSRFFSRIPRKVLVAVTIGIIILGGGAAWGYVAFFVRPTPEAALRRTFENFFAANAFEYKVTASIELPQRGSSTLHTFGATDSSDIKKVQKFRRLFLDKLFFRVSEELPDETIGGALMYHYRLELNKNNALDFAAGAYEINASTTLSAADRENLVANLAKWNATSSEIWIGEKDLLPHKIITTVFSLSYAPVTSYPSVGFGEESVATISFDLTFGNFNNISYVRKEPEGVKDFLEVIKAFDAARASSSAD